MGVTKKTVWLILLSALLTANTADAWQLPDSSYYQGTSYFSSGGFLGHIDFAVYDTLDSDGDEFADVLGDTAPGSGQYIYAYQIFSDADSYNTIDYFSVFGIGEGAIADSESGIGTTNNSPGDSSEEGVDATDASFNIDLTIGRWVFDYDGEHIVADEHSYFLILRSNQEWTVGGYTFAPIEDDSIIVPGDGTNPEPFTITLLGLGTIMLFSKRRNAAT